MSSPLILITNDDGIFSKGLRHLVKLINPIAKVVVVAPDSPQSAQSHAITINQPITCEKIDVDDGKQIDFICSGTPVDCVKLALAEILDRKPDLCISGINHGSNSSINVIYSGTMSAAIEAGMEGIPAIGFSLLDYNWDANFNPFKKYVKKICSTVLKKGMKKGVVLNVNFPNSENNTIKGIKICQQAEANWVEKFDKRQSPMGKDYYWLTGEFINYDKRKDTDEYALSKGYISIVPIQFDLTAHNYIDELKNWKLND